MLFIKNILIFIIGSVLLQNPIVNNFSNKHLLRRGIYLKNDSYTSTLQDKCYLGDKMDLERKFECLINNCNKKFIDGKSLTAHITWHHKITSREYYDTFLKKEDEGKCLFCDKEAKFLSISKGFRDFCTDKQCILESKRTKTLQTCIERYGGVGFASDILRTKTEDTKERRHGDRHFNNTEKAQETSLKKWGGVGFASEELRAKGEQTYYDRTGYRNPSENPEVLEKQVKTYKDKTGYDYPSQNPEVKKKKEDTCLKNYGVTSYFKSEEFKDRLKLIFLEKFGVECIFQSNYFKEKNKSTRKERYGNENYNNIEQNKQTCLKKYGVEYAIQDYDIFIKQQTSLKKKKYKLTKYITKFNDLIHYQSNYELEFIKFCENKNIRIINGDRVPYYFEGKKHYYFVDFKIFENDKCRLIEIKGNHIWYKEDLASGKINAKNEAAIQYSKDNNYLDFLFILLDMYKHNSFENFI